MDFSLEFYETLSGHKLAEEFVDSLKASNPVLAKQVVAGALRLKDRRAHKPPLSEHIQDDLFALRVGFGTIARMFYTIHGHQLWFLDGYVKKSQKIPPRQLAHGQTLMEEFYRRL